MPPGRRAIDDRLEPRAALREVLASIVDDLVGAEGSNELHVVGAADAGDVSAEVLRDLDRRGPERSRGAVDHELLAGRRPGLPERGERLRRAVAHGGRLVEGHPGWHVRDGSRGPDAQVLGVRTRPRRWLAEDAVAHGEPGHVRADLLDLPGELHAQRSPRAPEAEDQAVHERIRRSKVHVGLRNRRRANPHQDLAGARRRPRHLDDPEHLRRTVPILHDGLHGREDTADGRRA
jgi:hypothetical protein